MRPCTTGVRAHQSSRAQVAYAVDEMISLLRIWASALHTVRGLQWRGIRVLWLARGRSFCRCRWLGDFVTVVTDLCYWVYIGEIRWATTVTVAMISLIWASINLSSLGAKGTRHLARTRPPRPKHPPSRPPFRRPPCLSKQQ